MAVIATAGHVDHGKSSLVRALTGTDPDRLAEEQRRGMTIELGFAHVRGPRGATLSFVDVPGHVDLVRTMIAGASGSDVVMLVVDAREGWKPQTHEHLAVCELLGVRSGVVALSKADLVGPERIAEVTEESRTCLAGSPIEWAAFVATSTITGDGLGELATELEAAVERTGHPAPDLADRLDRPRLFIDRVFSIAGTGTVVTGTLESGTITVGADLVSVPGGHASTVRGIQVHGATVDAAREGMRCALNLARTSTTDVSRGEALVIDGQWHATNVFDAEVLVPRGAATDIGSGRGYTLHVGTNRQAATLRVLPASGPADERGLPHPLLVRVRTGSPLPLSPTDRFVLRRTGTDTTVAGGIVLDVAPVARPSRARPTGTTGAQLEHHGWVTVDVARRLTGRAVPAVAGDWTASPARVAETTGRLAALLDDGPVDLVGTAPHERDLLGAMPGVVVEHGTARRAGSDPLNAHPLALAIREAGVTPLPTADADRDIVRRLVRAAIVFEHDGIAFHVDTLGSLRPILDRLWADHPGGFAVSDLRTELGITRKHAVPLAECLDRAGLTRRAGDLRVPGPRVRG